MLIHNITNRVTGNKYRITDADLADKGCTLAEWLARKVNAYGPNPIVTSEDTTAQEVAAAVERLWRESWAWGNRQFAESDRTTILAWLAAGLLTPAGIQRWRDVIAWHDAIFTGPYAAAKAAITAAGTWVEPDWSAWPACPWGFFDFASERTG
jgi:hypothetical protein